jgi:hypothetical protein
MSYESLRQIGWRAVEVALIVVIFCVLANIILGEHSGAFVESVAVNALGLARDVPPGTLIGLALIALVYTWLKAYRRA